MATLAQHIVAIAKKEIGVREVGNSNCGVRVNQYKAATKLNPREAWPWCAAFVCWVAQEALAAFGKVSFKRPTTAGAWDFENWAAKQPSVHLLRRPSALDIRAGDIVVFTFSHIGIAYANGVTNDIATIEGNTDGQGSREGGGVYLKERHVSLIRSRIRLNVPVEFTPTDFVPLAPWCKTNKIAMEKVQVPSRFYDIKTETTYASLTELKEMLKK
jgi:hypothetical protein